MVDASASRERAYSFGSFRLLPSRQLLLEGERPVRLGHRSLEILTALVERPGELVTKAELMARVWPGVVVEEANLRVQITALRKALGEGRPGHRYVTSVIGRGYCFVAPVEPCEPTPGAQSSAVPRKHNLPPSLIRTIGRADTLGALLKHLRQHRLVSIVGPGGIGKTTVALAAADALMSAYDHGVWFVDLAPLRDPQLVPATLASALGLEIRSRDVVEGLMSHLQDKRLLILLDNCEHVIGAAAAVAEQIITGAPNVDILATSREPLRLSQEHVHRLLPLASPPRRSDPTAAEALSFPAVQLFVERATASREDFELSDAEAPIVSDICRKLDGIALAIELAAARADAFGIHQLAALLNDGFRLGNQGRRTAPARQQTLAATLDWSYRLLSEDERVILRRLSVFTGDFSLESARAVAAGGHIAGPEIVGGVANLMAKSLISADVSDVAVRYRLLDTTRAYAIEKLRESGEAPLASRAHAEFYRDLLDRARAEWARRSTDEWLGIYRQEVDNIRSALDWAFSAGGDPAIGVSLSVAAAILLFDLGQLHACVASAERALDAIEADPGHDLHSEMRLRSALGAALVYTRGPGEATDAAWLRALELATELGEADYEARALWGLWNARLYGGSPRVALSFAERFCDLAAKRGDTAKLLMGQRITAISKHYLGEQAEAKNTLEYMLSRYERDLHRWHTAGFRVDHRIVGRANLARVLWLQGAPDQALSLSQGALADAQALGHVMTLQYVLSETAIPLALLVGDLDAAGRLTALLLDLATRHGFFIWEACGRCFEAIRLVRSGNPGTGLPLLRAAVAKLRHTGFEAHITFILSMLAEAMCDAGEIEEGLVAVDEGLARCEAHEDRWCISELLRVRGRLAWAKGSIATAEENFQEASAWARRQGALSWELRAVTCLAQLRHQSGKAAEACELLSSVYDRFTEGYDTSDLRTAGAWIGTLRPHLD